jgi:hypothetical protein
MLGSLVKRAGAAVTGDSDYEFGDITKTAASKVGDGAAAAADVAGGAAAAVGGVALETATVVSDATTGAVSLVFEESARAAGAVGGARAEGAAMLVGGVATATVGAATTVVGITLAKAGAVVHEGVKLGGDAVEGALNTVATGFHNLTVTEQEERAALLHALRTSKEVGPERVAIQQRLAIAKCFHERLAAQICWPVEGLDDFPFDIVIRIAEVIEAKPAGPAPPGAGTITIHRPLAAATGALTDAAVHASHTGLRTGMKTGFLCAGLGGFALVAGEHLPIGFCMA